MRSHSDHWFAGDTGVATGGGTSSDGETAADAAGPPTAPGAGVIIPSAAVEAFDSGAGPGVASVAEAPVGVAGAVGVVAVAGGTVGLVAVAGGALVGVMVAGVGVGLVAEEVAAPVVGGDPVAVDVWVTVAGGCVELPEVAAPARNGKPIASPNAVATIAAWRAVLLAIWRPYIATES